MPMKGDETATESLATSLETIKQNSIYRYLLASGINTALGITIIATLYRVTRSAQTTLLLSTLLGYLYSLASYNRIAFRSERGHPPYLRYALVYASALTLNALITWQIMRATGSFIISQLVSMPTVLSLQWAASRFWAFRPNRKL
jgi:hypothetical protein